MLRDDHAVLVGRKGKVAVEAREVDVGRTDSQERDGDSIGVLKAHRSTTSGSTNHQEGVDERFPSERNNSIAEDRADSGISSRRDGVEKGDIAEERDKKDISDEDASAD
jgi:hypothetical protein